MKRRFYGFLALLTAIVLLTAGIPASAEEAGDLAVTAVPAGEPRVRSALGVEEGSLDLNCKSAVLIEETTGTVLYVQNAEEALPPASVTKIMTLLLVMEALDSGSLHMDDQVTVSANAASMGGSQVYLKEGERMRVEDLLKSVVIASANDAAVALAETLCGTVASFVEKMNARAAELGMTSTVFENVTGLDDTAERHLTSAYDIALMSRALIAHKTILQYSSIWMDSIRDGAFGLTNTNRLVRFYPGCTGLKTGSTSKAGFCVSVTAERNGFSLICVIMGAESRDVRNAAAASLLDWGFANFGLFTAPSEPAGTIRVRGGTADECQTVRQPFSCVLPKSGIARVEGRVTLPEVAEAPVREGQTLGNVTYLLDGNEIGSAGILAAEPVERIGFFEILCRMAARFLLI